MSPSQPGVWLRLVRIPLAPTAVWDVVACTALALAAAGRNLASVSVLDWVLLALTSFCVYCAGMAANDLADRERDRELAPDRPLPSRQVSARSVGVVVFLLAVAAIAVGGGGSGSRIAVLAAVAFAFLYDFGTKRTVVLGSVTMGCVRFANAAVGTVPLVVAGAAPAWVLLAPAAIGLYSTAVTLWSTTEESPSTARRIVARVLLSLSFVLAGGLPWLVAGRPTLGVLVGAGMLTSVAFARTPKAGPAKRQVLEMLLGLYFLSMCIATAGNGGTLAVNVAAFVTAVVLIWGSQRMVRALRRSAAGTTPAA